MPRGVKVQILSSVLWAGHGALTKLIARLGRFESSRSTCLRNSMVEYHTFNVRVVGSSPTGDILAEVAQLAVQRFCKP